MGSVPLLAHGPRLKARSGRRGGACGGVRIQFRPSSLMIALMLCFGDRGFICMALRTLLLGVATVTVRSTVKMPN